MKIQIDYYKMIGNKSMGDGNTIPQNQELILIKKEEDGLLFLETHKKDYKMLFWARESEVEFVQTVEEDWDEEKINQRNRYINGEFI